MTSAPGYGPPTDDYYSAVRPVAGADVNRSRERTDPWRIVLVVLGCLVGPPCAVYVGFWGAVTFTGCFFSCGEAQPLLGAVLLALALALLLTGPLLAGLLIRRASAVGWAVLGVLGGGACLAVLTGVL